MAGESRYGPKKRVRVWRCACDKMIAIVLKYSGYRRLGAAIVCTSYMRKIYEVRNETLECGEPLYIAA
jgi:hypothetical protein